jgi:hypothetical protein
VTSASQLSAVAQLAAALGERRPEYTIGLPLNDISAEASKIRFPQELLAIGYLLRDLGEGRDSFISALDTRALKSAANKDVGDLDLRWVYALEEQVEALLTLIRDATSSQSSQEPSPDNDEINEDSITPSLPNNAHPRQRRRRRLGGTEGSAPFDSR